MKYISSISAMVLVAACSTGGGGGSNANGTETFSDLRATFLSINNEIDFNSVVDASTLPTSGSANYNGSVFFTTPQSLIVIGELDLAVDFAASQFDGEATGFADEKGFAYDGKLEVANGDINRSADPDTTYAFVGEIDGTISDPDDNAYAVDAFIVGDFFGSDEEYIAGVIKGDVESDLGDFELTSDNSAFRAEK